MGRVIFLDSTKSISYVALDSLGEFWQEDNMMLYADNKVNNKCCFLIAFD